MKKIFAIIIAAVAMFTIEANAQTAKCLLSHNGNVTLYDASSISSAITAAAVGDTIYLSEGSFPGFTISKNVSFIGAGETSIINGSVSVNISGTTTFTTILMEGVKITGKLEIKSSTNNLRIRSCKIGSATFTGGNANNVTFEKCYFTGSITMDPTYVKSGTVINSKIYCTYSTCSSTTFVNCNIYEISSEISSTFLNCILQKVSNYSFYSIGSGNFLTNCLYYQYATLYGIGTSACVTKDCYRSGSDVLDTSCYCLVGASSCSGNDGTEVGIYGGTTPYTLRPSAPTVTSASVTVDSNNQTLNVNIQVTAQ